MREMGKQGERYGELHLYLCCLISLCFSKEIKPGGKVLRFDRVWLWDFKDLLISFPGLFCIYKKMRYRSKGVTKVHSFWTRR